MKRTALSFHMSRRTGRSRRRTTRAPGNGWDDCNRVAGRNRGIGTLEISNILVIQIDVYERPQTAILRIELLFQRWIPIEKRLQCRTNRSTCDLDYPLSVCVAAQ